MDLFRISCQTCQTPLSVRHEEAIGQIYQCPRCGSMVLVESPSVQSDTASHHVDARPTVEERDEDSTGDSIGTKTPSEKARWMTGPSVERTTGEFSESNDSQRDLESTHSADTPPGPDVDDLLVNTASQASVGNNDQLDESKVAAAGATLIPDDSSTLPLPDAAWANSGQAAFRSWLLYGMAAVVGVLGSAFMITVVILSSNTGHQVDVVESKPSQRSQVRQDSATTDVTESLPDKTVSTADVVERSDVAAQPTVGEHAVELENPFQAEEPLETASESDASMDELSNPQTLLPTEVSPKEQVILHEDTTAGSVDVTTDPVEGAIDLVSEESQRTKPPPVPRKTNVGKQLSLVIPSIEFEDVELQECLRFLSDLTTVPITIEPESLLLARKTATSSVRWQADNHSVREMLDDIMRQQRLACVVRDNQLLVTSRTTDAAGLKEIGYPIGDLIQRTDETASHWEAIITSLIAPETWGDQEGSAMMVVEGDSLEIRQTVAMHWEILQLCEKIRMARSLPIRSRYPVEQFQLTPRALQADELLATVVSLNDVVPTRLVEILDRLEDETGCQFLVDWLSTSREGVYPDMETTFSTQDQPLEQALRTLLSPIGLAYRVVDRTMLQITSHEDFEKRLEVEVYDIDDWPDDDGQKLITVLAEAVDVDGAVGHHLLALPNDHLVVARLSQSQHQRLVRYLQSRTNEKGVRNL